MPKHLRVVVLLASACQLRGAEVSGLRRRGVDLLHGTLSVELTRTKTMAGQMIVRAPKSDAGKCPVVIPSNVLPVLERHLEQPVGFDPDSPVIVGEKGGPLLPQVLATSWTKARRKVVRTDLPSPRSQTLWAHVGGCYGCHDYRADAPSGTRVPGGGIALPPRRRGP